MLHASNVVLVIKGALLSAGQLLVKFSTMASTGLHLVLFILFISLTSTAEGSEGLCEHNFDCEACTESKRQCMWTVKFVGDAYGEKPKVFGCKPRKNLAIDQFLDYKGNSAQCMAFDNKHNVE